MKTNTITTIKLVPDDGKWLTQVNLEENDVRIFSDSVYCPAGQESAWMEVDNEFKTKWETEHPAPEAEVTE